MEIILIILFNIIIYWRSLSFGLVIDDVRRYELIKAGLFNNRKWFRFVQLRLYGSGTFGTNTRIDHAFTVFLHTTICVLIYLAFGSNQISFFAATLYACNPSNNQTSIWMNGRRYAINVILMLLILWLGVWVAPLYFLMPIFQINAIFTPILLGWQYALVIPAFFLLYNQHIIKWFKNRYMEIPQGELRAYHPRRIIPIIKTYGFYFFKMLFPGTNLFFYPMLYFWGVSKEGNEEAYRLNWHFSRGMLALILTATAILLLKDQYRIYAIMLFLSTFQWSNVLTATQITCDRYMSLPNVFMMFLVSYGLAEYAGPWGLPIIGLLIGYYLSNLFHVMGMYKDLDDFYDYNIFHNPKGISAHTFKASALLSATDHLAAWEIVRHGLHHNPKDFKMLYLAAVCCKHLREEKLSKEFIFRAEQNFYLGQEDKLKKLIEKIKNN